MDGDAAARGKRRVQRKVLEPVVQDIMADAMKRKKKPKAKPAMPKVNTSLAELTALKDYFKTIQ
jgi:hypothetical protein